MGNASSAERPLRYSQRLSKQKIPPQEPTYTSNLPDLPDDIPPVDSTRYSRFYLSASVPPSPYISNFSQGCADTPSFYGTPQTQRPTRRDYEPLTRLMNHSSPSLATRPQRQSTGMAVQTKHLPTSVSAMNLQDMRYRSESFNTYKHGGRSPVREYGPHADELLRVKSDMHPESLPTTSTRPDHPERLESYESNHSSVPTGSYTDNVNTDESMYVPLRRRSTNRVPGIATRLPKGDVPMPLPFFPPIQPDEPVSPASIESTSPPSPPHVQIDESEERVESPDLPMPKFVHDHERARTPSAGEYGQLGAIKFGGLRIMNASPVPSYRSSSGGSSRLHYSVERDGYSTAPQQHDTRRHSGLMQEILVDDPSFLPLEHGTPPKQAPSRESTRPHSPKDSSLRQDKQSLPEAIARLEGTDDEDISRSDSGVESTSSSSASQKRLSKTDSGYGSNLSLASFKLGRSRRGSSNTDNKSDASTDSVPETLHLKVNKRSSWLAVSNKTRSFVISPHQRRKSSTALDVQFPKPPPRMFLSNGAHDNLLSVPAIPARVEQSLRLHNGEFPTNTRRLTLRNEPSKESLHTIVSIESVEAPKEQPILNNDKLNRHSAQALSRLPSFVRESMPRSWLVDPGKPITRKPVNSKSKDARLSLPSRPTLTADDYRTAPVGRIKRGSVPSSPSSKQPSPPISTQTSPSLPQGPRRRVSAENYDDSNKDLHCVASMEDMLAQLRRTDTPLPMKTGRPRHSLPAPSTRITTHDDMRSELHFGFEEKYGKDMGRTWNLDQDDAPQRFHLPPHATYRA